MAVVGFNVGSTISLGDMSLAVDYLLDKDAFEPDLQVIKQKISGKELAQQSELSQLAELRQPEKQEDVLEKQMDIIEDTNLGVEEEIQFKEIGVEDVEFSGFEGIESIESIEVEADDEQSDSDNDDDEFEISEDDLFGDDEEDEEQDKSDEFEISEDDLVGVVDESSEEDTNVEGTGSEDDEFDLSDMGDFEDSEENEEEAVPEVKVAKKVEIKAEPLPVQPKVVVKQAEDNSSKLLEREQELKKKLDDLNRQKEEAKKKELQLLEQEVLRAEKEMALQKAKQEAAAKQQNSIKNVKASTPTVQSRQPEQRRPVEKQVPVQKPVEKQVELQPSSNISKYSAMDIEALYSEVRRFMQRMGVSKSIVDKKILENEFGSINIKKLILKSYLISIGKGVTIGR